MKEFQADAVAYGATPTTEYGARIGGPGVSVDGRSYVADTVTERKNDPVIRRLLQTLVVANVREPEFSAIRHILERGLPSLLEYERMVETGAREDDWHAEENEREAKRLARRTWFEKWWDRTFDNVE